MGSLGKKGGSGKDDRRRLRLRLEEDVLEKVVDVQTSFQSPMANTLSRSANDDDEE